MLGFTIDSVTMFINWDKLSDYDFDWLDNIIDAKMIGKNKMKEGKGFYKNMFIRYSETQGMYIKGSLSNFYKGYNSILAYDELPKAVNKLGSELGLNLHNARLYRVDLALNIETDNPVSHYTHSLFTDLPRFKKLAQDDGVRFESKKKVFAIYNKSLELLEKRGINCGMNILRLELRLWKNLGEVFKIKEMTVQDLYAVESYKALVQTFRKYYHNIKKQTVVKGLSDIEQLTPSKLTKFLKRSCIETVFGGEDKAYEFIEQAAQQGKIKHPNDKCRCKKIITDCSKNKAISEQHPLIIELNNKVDAACMEILNN